MPVSWPSPRPKPTPEPEPAVDTADDGPEHPDPCVVTGHDGRSYKAYTIPMVDLHIRNLGKRIASVKSPANADLYREDRDHLLEHRHVLMLCRDMGDETV